ncbi:hypothetical protein KAS41_01430 [Candidatus Parcubacteria bacterium]|nr:hypothetical protein [Candidatus Parcubacteria bacterium]
MANLIIEILGWAGVFMVWIAYVLITMEKMKSASRIYQGLNLFGSLLIAQNAFFNKAYPSVVANLTWIAVATYGFLKIIKSNKQKSKF